MKKRIIPKKQFREREFPRITGNDYCKCESGKKTKNCHPENAIKSRKDYQRDEFINNRLRPCLQQLLTEKSGFKVEDVNGFKCCLPPEGDPRRSWCAKWYEVDGVRIPHWALFAKENEKKSEEKAEEKAEEQSKQEVVQSE